MSCMNNNNGGSLSTGRKKTPSHNFERKSLSDSVVEFLLTLGIGEFESINVKSIARRFKVNRSYLSHKFKQDMKFSLSEYILMIKILRSTNLLAARKDISVDNLARIMGYSNRDYFIKLFKSHMGTTPGKYKSVLKKMAYFDS